jgi:hypothetical protein
VQWLAPEILVVAAVALACSWLALGHGIAGFFAAVVLAAALGGLMGAVGKRYPMLYRQNRRDRRRHSQREAGD